MAVDKIANGVIVTMTYRLTVEDEIVEEAIADDPLVYLHGSDNIVPGLEEELEGKTVGDRLSVTLPPEKAYGTYDEDAVQEMDAGTFDADEDITVGTPVEVEDDEGDLYEAIVREITDEKIVLDFNPPLVDKTVRFDVEVLALRTASEDELEIGMPSEFYYEHDDHDGYEH